MAHCYHARVFHHSSPPCSRRGIPPAMGAAAKFFILLTTPFPLFHPCPSLLRLASIATLPHTLSHLDQRHHHVSPSPSRHLGFLCSKSSRRCLHVQSDLSDDRFSDPSGLSPAQRARQPLPEWSRLIDVLASRGYFDRHDFGVVDEDEFVLVEDLPDDFVRVAHSCLALAHDRPNLLGFALYSIYSVLTWLQLVFCIFKLSCLLFENIITYGQFSSLAID